MAGPTRSKRPAGGSSVYEALTGWVDLAPAIKAAWDAGPDADPGSYHPANAGDWTLTHTPGAPGTLTLAGTTGATQRDGWNEWARFNAGNFAALMGVDGAVLADEDTVMIFRAIPVALGTRNATVPAMVVQVSPGASAPSQSAASGAAGVSWSADASTSGQSGASSTSMQGAGAVALGGTLLVLGQQFDSTGRIARRITILGSDESVSTYNDSAPGTTGVVASATSRLWFGAGQASTTAAAFTGFEASFEARLLRRSQVPWDPDFGL